MSGSKRTILILAAVVAMVLVTVAVVTASPAAGPQQAAAPTPTPKAGSSQGDWARIKQAGKIVVGTSADYPPFEYYDSNFRLDGFDIALMNEIGKQLGVQVQYKDAAFDGLLDAVQLGEIDMAIAAIGITPEREELVDFSDVYFVDEEAVLARKDSRVGEIKSIEDVAHLRWGVQRGTVFATWAENNLVNKGLTPPEDLMLYTSPDQAIRDLKQGRIDLVILDAPAADDYVQQGGVKIVERGSNRLLLGMAVPSGATALQGQLNGALTKLQDQGTVSQLVQKYMKVKPEDIIPVPTPAVATPTPSAVAAPTVEACKDSMTWVQDLTYDDNNRKSPPVLQPGQAFTKGWRVRNSGTCTWDQTYTLACTGGNSSLSCMGGSAVRVNGTVPPGATYDFKVALTAPTIPGTYEGDWHMRDWSGDEFGQLLYVYITVPGATPPPPPAQPTATPVPNISYWADSTSLQVGQCTNIHWNVQNVQAVYWQGQGVNGSNQTRQVCPTQTTTYTLSVVQNNGQTVNQTITIYVQAPPAGKPVIVQFDAAPASLPLGGCVNISWNVEGEVSNITLYMNDTPIWASAPVRGSKDDSCPGAPGTYAYKLDVSGPGGNAQSVKYVNVLASGPPPPPPPPDVPPPPPVVPPPPPPAP